jgi:predicted DNA-binding protein (UPF0278 family)
MLEALELKRKRRMLMYRIIDGKGTGKTSRLLLLAKEQNGVVVCADPVAMINKAYSYGLTGIDYVSYYEFFTEVTRTARPYDARPIFIDELDKYLLFISSNLTGYTLSNED